MIAKEIIEKYNTSLQTIKRRIKDGSLNPTKGKGNVNIFDEDEVDNVFGNKLTPLDELKIVLKSHYGYEPYTFIGDYIDNVTNISLICNTCKNNIEVKPGNMKNNIRLKRNPSCKYCGIKHSAKGHLKSKEDYLKDLKSICKNNYTLLGEYDGINEKTSHKCNICGHIWNVTPSSLVYSYKNGKHSCPSCNNMIRDDRDYTERLNDINTNIIALESYNGRKTPILHRCNICNHEWKSTPCSRLSGNGCPSCSNKISQSKGELEIISFLEENELKVETRNRKLLNGKEIDIYLPDYKIGIELNGNYWHSEKYKGKKYHLEKTELAESKGIRLIQVMDDEWDTKTDIVKSKLLYLLKKSKLSKIYARKCIVKEISAPIKNAFLDKNHIQGADMSNIKLGLYYENNLVSVMTFTKPRIPMGQGGKKNSYDYELSRFASDIDYVIIGGFSKLFKYFENNYSWNSIVSYADRRWSLGNLYSTTGWIHLHDTKPNYWYVDKNLKTRYHRFNFRKQVLKDKFPKEYDSSLTEFQIMDNTKYFRVWDCGNKAYKYVRNNQ